MPIKNMRLLLLMYMYGIHHDRTSSSWSHIRLLFMLERFSICYLHIKLLF